MTRINLVEPHELTDQHLFAEFREIKMVPKALRRSLDAARRRSSDPLAYVLDRIPPAFTLNTGHVAFFYDKGLYLRLRYVDIIAELSRRGTHTFNTDSPLDPDNVFKGLPSAFNMDYTPTADALSLIRSRIAEKIALRPGWYRYYGEVI